MPENDFEKRVQQKMEELKLHPSDPVWEGIEKEINKRKKRRRIMLLLPFLAGLLLLGYGGYHFIGTARKNSTTSLEKQLPNEQTAATSGSADSILTKGSKKSATISSKPNENSVPIKANKTVKQDKPSLKAKIQKPITHRKPNEKPIKAIELVSKMSNDQPRPSNQDVAEDRTPLPTRDTVVLSSTQPMIKEKIADKVIKADSTNLIASDEKKDTTTKTEIATSVVTPTAPKPDRKKAKKDNASWYSVHLAIGASDIRTQRYSFSSQSLSTSGSPGTVTGGGGGGPVTSPTVNSSETFPGLAVRLGVDWEKPISKRLLFVTGINYAYYSEKIHVGSQFNGSILVYYSDANGQSINRYYSPGEQQYFTNHFHFIDIPALLRWQPRPGVKLPVSWEIGASVSQLIQSNALVFDTVLVGVYFHNKALFHKTHFNLLGSVRFHLGNWSVGPQAVLDLTRTIREGSDRDRYLFGGFINVGYSFKRKKK